MTNSTKKKPLVVIFGRTNVGKSTLFNRLTESEKALTSKIEGTTRDSNADSVEWRGKNFELVDTGGIIDETSELILGKKKVKAGDIDSKVQKQALNFIKKSDLVLFLVDAKVGLLPQDELMAKYLKRRREKKVLLVANKVDDFKKSGETAQFNKLGLGEPFPVSAATGSGTGDLLDLILKKIRAPKSVEEESPDHIPVCILGKPNVGKSSLLNSFLGEEKVIVSDIPHTTREPQNIEINYQDQTITLVDTAGISKKAPRSKDLEKEGIERSLKSLRKSQIALLVIDTSEGITHQDCRLVEKITEIGKSLIVIANKWDLIDPKDSKAYTTYIQNKFPFAVWAPIQFISAKNGRKVPKILDLILEARDSREKKLSQSQLDKFLNRVVKIHPPAKSKGIKPPYIYKITQSGINPPSFEIKIGPKDNLHFSYVNFIKNKLRERFKLSATPIKIYVKK